MKIKPIKTTQPTDHEFERHHKYWCDKSDKEVQKEIERMDKHIQKLHRSSLGEMGFNGHRSTRKATASFAVGNMTAEKWDLERYLEKRKKELNL